MHLYKHVLFFYLIILFYMHSLSKTRSPFYITVHEAKDVLIRDISLVNRVQLTVLVSVVKDMLFNCMTINDVNLDVSQLLYIH